ncbi:MAG: acyl-CoA dehydrogenase family protein [Candidatus Wallbacteria bacterium]|nr:acyl-CoA dehydrogenase family protein [Candidatus Wallbacteria bacterium]
MSQVTPEPSSPRPAPFQTTDEQSALADEVLKFARAEAAPHELAEEFAMPLWRKMAELGLMGLPIPREYGGGDSDLTTTVLAVEAFVRGGGSLSMALSWGASTVLFGIPVLVFGTSEQKQRYLPRIASGEWIGAFALTEPGAGSDAASLRTRARRTDGGWLLDGAKMFITNGPIADAFLVFASTDPARGRNGISAFVIDRETPGFTCGQPLHKMGHRGSPTSELVLQDCRVPDTALLGKEGRGFVEVAFSTLEWERSCLLGPGAGACALALERSARYALSRAQFGRPVAEFGAVRQLLGDMQARCFAAALHWRRLGWLKDAGVPAVTESSIAKLVISEDCLRVADSAVQIHGGYGYIREYPVEQFYRDVKLYTLGGGTSEIQQRILAETLLKEHRDGRHPERLSTRDPLLRALAGDAAVDRIQEMRALGRATAASVLEASLRHDQPELAWAVALDELAAQDRLESLPCGPAQGPVPPRVHIRAAACACGLAAAALERGLDLALSLRTDHPDHELQEQIFPLARARAELDTARLLVWRAALSTDAAGRETAPLAAAARLRASAAATQALLAVSDLTGDVPWATSLFRSVAELRRAGGTDSELREALAGFAIAQAQC